jgi:hypothetical protein
MLIILVAIIIIITVLAIFFGKITGYFGTSIDLCQDSDLGKNFWEKGFVQGQFNNLERSLRPEYYFDEDYCKNEKVVVEYFCIKQGIHSYKQAEQYRCPEKCEDGRCTGVALETPKQGFWDKVLNFFGV